jgi:hypothetical protein
MRNTLPLIIGVALLAATPAAAQVTDNTADSNAVAVTNDTAATDNLEVTTDPLVADPANDLAAAPATDVPVETYGEPAPAKKRGFPWGVLGLLGLAGLIGRRSR